MKYRRATEKSLTTTYLTGKRRKAMVRMISMALYTTLSLKILPLYAIMALGFIAGKYLRVDKESIARLLLYVLVPIIIFDGALTTVIDIGSIVLPIFFFIVSCCLSLTAYWVGSYVWTDSTKNIFAYTAGTGNTGYFGIPVALAIFGKESLGLMVFATMGLVLFESTLGFFVSARGSFTPKESVRRLFILPSVYAFIAGLTLNLFHVYTPEWYGVFSDNFRGTYTVLGSMMAGLGLSGFQKLSVDYKFLGLSFFVKFIVYPAIALGFISLDRHWLHLFTPLMRQVVILLSITPMAVNTVVLATALKVQPEKAAMGVLTSTLFALLVIPAVMAFIQ